MGKEVSTEIDVLDLLEANIERVTAGLKESGEGTAYVEGQIEYLTTLYDRLGDVPKDVRPKDLLADVAEELGVEMTVGRIDPTPLEDREAGILSMWSLSLGFVEGAARGVQHTMDALEDQDGLSAVAKGDTE